jgi:hypothetical protein
MSGGKKSFAPTIAGCGLSFYCNRQFFFMKKIQTGFENKKYQKIIKSVEKTC